MKKFLAIFMALVMAMGLLTACASESSSSSSEASSEDSSEDSTEDSEEKIKIVTTIFPIYDWVKSVLGDEIDNVELTLLLDTGVDMHSYEPTAAEMIEIIECDLFIYVGGESDDWVEDTLSNGANENMEVINLFDVLGDSVKEEELVEGMEEEEHDHDEEESTDDEEDHDDEEEDHDHDEEESENDEHVWLSLLNAEVICQEIAERLNILDSNNASVYNENCDTYVLELQALDSQYEEVVANATIDTILFGDRFPFRYLVDDYDIEYYAAFAGCSSESDASIETITFLAEKVNELDLSVILTIDGSDNSLAETIIASTTDKDQTILTLDSMQTTDSTEIENGATYLSIMESNLSILQEALS